METMEKNPRDDRSQVREGAAGERSALLRAVYSRYSLPILGGVIIGLVATFLLRLAGKHLF